MTMRCNTCKLDKPEADMYVRAGKVIRSCRSCRQEQMRRAAVTRARTMQTVKISRPVAAQTLAPPPADTATGVNPVLDIQPSWGINAVIEDGRLVLRQSDDEGNTDEIGLSRSEASTLFARFGAWAGVGDGAPSGGGLLHPNGHRGLGNGAQHAPATN
jgi:hypothetical protein